MSLLMEALRKAEEAKRRGQQEQTDQQDSSEAADPGADPVDQPTSRPAPAPAPPADTPAQRGLSLEPLARDDEPGKLPDTDDTPAASAVEPPAHDAGIGAATFELTPRDDLDDMSADDENEQDPVARYAEDDSELPEYTGRRHYGDYPVSDEPAPANDEAPETRDFEPPAPAEIPDTDSPAAPPPTPRRGAEADAATTSTEDEAAELRRVVRVGGQTRDQQAAASMFAAKRHKPGTPSYRTPLFVTLLVIVAIGGGGLAYLGMQSGSGLGVNPELANYDLQNRPLLPSPADNPPTGTEAVNDSSAAAPGDLPGTGSPAPVAVDDAPVAPAGNAGIAESADNAGAADTRESIAGAAVNAGTLDATARNEPAASMETTDSAGTADSTAVAATRDAAPGAAASADAPANNAASPDRLQIQRASGRPAVNASVQSAYNTFQAGDYANAAMLYRQALENAPNNRDALMGLGAIYLRTGDPGAARAQYIRVLELNPRDAYARTGLLQTLGNSNNPEFENELRAQLANTPTLAPLHFALGNFYAANGRWSEAQAAYFDALLHARNSADGPVSPDYAFNLAVSLERLQQPAAALDYYRQAEALATSSPPGFDMQLLRNRLATLEQTPQ